MTLVVVPYLAVLALLLAFAIHRGHLVWLLLKHKADSPPAPAPQPDAPVVTVQLPLYNEPDVVGRLLDAVAELDWPRDRLEIQVLDDSTDDTSERARAKVAALRERGFDARLIRRANRAGYKAGALDHGLRLARGTLIAIFDADFVPDPSFLRQLAPHFGDAHVGCVQARWGHLNRTASLLTRLQALMLDGHHLVENRARQAAGRFFNFSGTAGIWRRDAIERAGGWQHDTLTEDLDLSYRAQLEGYRFVYRADHVAPAELPEAIEAFRAQQFRWAKGTVQTARKLLPRILRARLPIGVRLEALAHLLPHLAYPLLICLTVLLLPTLLALPSSSPLVLGIVDIPLALASMGPMATFYGLAERTQGRSALGALCLLPCVIALGAGMAPHLARAVWQGLRHRGGEFVRTPKSGGARARYRARTAPPILEIVLALWSGASVIVAILGGHFVAAPFAALSTLGFLAVALTVLVERACPRKSS